MHGFFMVIYGLYTVITYHYNTKSKKVIEFLKALQA